MYRLNVGSFNHLLSLIKSDIETKNVEVAVRSTGSKVRGRSGVTGVTKSSFQNWVPGNPGTQIMKI